MENQNPLYKLQIFLNKVVVTTVVTTVKQRCLTTLLILGMKRSPVAGGLSDIH